MELKLGKMTSREVAEWMGLSYNYYKNHRIEKLQILEYFADFEEVYGGVLIKEIHIPVFEKNFQIYDQIYAQMVIEAESHLTSIAGMVRKLKYLYPEQYEDVKDSTLRYRLSKAGIRTFGKTVVDKSELENVGICGVRNYVWAVKLSDLNEYRFMTSEEHKIYRQLCDEYIKENKDIIKLEEQRSLLRAANQSGELTDDDYNYELKKLNERDNFYKWVIKPFMEETGLILACTTEHEIFAQQVQKILEMEFN